MMRADGMAPIDIRQHARHTTHVAPTSRLPSTPRWHQRCRPRWSRPSHRQSAATPTATGRRSPAPPAPPPRPYRGPRQPAATPGSPAQQWRPPRPSSHDAQPLRDGDAAPRRRSTTNAADVAATNDARNDGASGLTDRPPQRQPRHRLFGLARLRDRDTTPPRPTKHVHLYLEFCACLCLCLCLCLFLCLCASACVDEDVYVDADVYVDVFVNRCGYTHIMILWRRTRNDHTSSCFFPVAPSLFLDVCISTHDVPSDAFRGHACDACLGRCYLCVFQSLRRPAKQSITCRASRCATFMIASLCATGAAFSAFASRRLWWNEIFVHVGTRPSSCLSRGLQCSTFLRLFESARSHNKLHVAHQWANIGEPGNVGHDSVLAAFPHCLLHATRRLEARLSFALFGSGPRALW